MKKLHKRAVWIFFISYLMRLGIVPVAFGLYLLSLIPETEMTHTTFYSAILISIFANIILWFIVSYLWAWLSCHLYRYSLGENAFNKEVGVASKKYVSIPYENIRNIEIDRGLLARMLGLSELHIEQIGSTHSSAAGHLPGLPKGEAQQLKDELIKRSHNAKYG